jgi:uncharacterized membrane protein YdbT with pleckstrin-like domain
VDGFSKYHFKDLEQGEEIVKVVHRNWFYLLEQFFLIFLIVGLAAGATIMLPMYFPKLLGSANEPFLLFAQNFFMLAVWIYAFLIWVDYYFDIWIITTQRVVNIEQKGLFTRKVSELKYEKIQDITTEVIGFIPTILNFGDLQIQTAAEQEQFRFKAVSDPYHLKNLIVEMQRKNSKAETQELGEMIREKIEG